MPVIALTHNPDHYLIVTEINEEGVHITDPEKGNVSIVCLKLSLKRYGRVTPSSLTNWNARIMPYQLTDEELKNLHGKDLLLRCPESGNGTDNPHAGVP